MENIEYINKKIEPRITKTEKVKNQKSIEILEMSLGNIDWKERGEATVENDKLKINLAYSPSKRGKNWRTLTSLKISPVNGDNNYSLELLADLKPETFISIGTKNFSGFKGFNHETKEILFDDDLLTSKGLIQLLHEIGHNAYSESPKNKDQTGLSFIGRLTISKFSSNEKIKKLAKEYRSERDAHAYTLNKLKPFIRSNILPKEAVLDLMHGEALQRYSSYLRGLTEGAIQSLWNDIKELFEKEIKNSPK